MSHAKRVVFVVVVVAGALIATPLAVNEPPVYAQACPNEAVREEQGGPAIVLPDCRAYEMVSPAGSVPESGSGVAALGGDRFGYSEREPYPGSDEEGMYLLATREVNGWSVQNTTPPQGGLHDAHSLVCDPAVFYSSELTIAVLEDGWNQVEEGADRLCEGDDPPLVAGEPRGYGNLFLRNNEDDAYQLIDRPPEAGPPANAVLLDGSSDLTRVVFEEEAKLTPQALAGPDLYEWTGNDDRLLTFLPNGEPVNGALVSTVNEEGNNSAPFTHAVSSDGETVFFYAGGRLYARLHAGNEPAQTGTCSVQSVGACTVQVDAAQAGAPEPGGGGVFLDASEDGSRVFFTDERKLTENAVALSRAPDLYEYNVATGILTDLTVPASGLAEVLGFSGASADGSYVYFVAKGVLSSTQTNSFGESAERYKPNLYVLHDGSTTFIATLEPETDGLDWQERRPSKNNGQPTVRVTSEGGYMIFNTDRQLDPAYNNEPLETSECSSRCTEIYLYDAGENKLSCVSCAPSGELPSGPSKIPVPEDELRSGASAEYLQHDLTSEGTVFFDTRTPLLPQAIDGEVNVYEYENGSLRLISSGAAVGASEFRDASANGEDLFFSTGQSLVRNDTDNTTSIYDARVDGGFPSSSGETQETSACESMEACRPALDELPALLSVASASLSTGGNLLAPPGPVTPSPPAGEKMGKRGLARALQFARALRECASKPKRQRAQCRAGVRRRFAHRPRSRTKRRKQTRKSSTSGRTLR